MNVRQGAASEEVCMSAPDPRLNAPATDASNSRLIRTAMWVAIWALIAAAVVCVIWVFIGSQNDLIGRAFLTILLLAAFAGATMLDAKLAPRRPAWFALASMVVWVATMLIGAFLIWMPYSGFDFFGDTFGRFASFLLIVLILQLALLHIRLITRAIDRRGTALTRPMAYVTMGLVIVLAVMLVLPLMLHEWVDFHDIYWRLVVAITILAAVGTALVPLMNALFAPRRPRHATRPQAPPGWPTYADGVTPLPMLPDGNPDWNSYYAGYPAAPPAMPPQYASATPPQYAPATQQQWQSDSPQPGSPQQWAPQQPPAPQWAPQQVLPQWSSQPQWGAPPQPVVAPQDASGPQPETAPPAAPPPAAVPAPTLQQQAQEPPSPAPQHAAEPSAAQPTAQPPAENAPPAPGYQGYPPPPPPPR